jgi:predicted RNase H-like HicB family nuclease
MENIRLKAILYEKDLKFEVYNDGEFFCARCFVADIFTQGKVLDELYHNIKEALNLYFEDPEAEINRNDYNGFLL